MVKNALYLVKDTIFELVKKLGGQANDDKQRPMVCLLPSSENEHLYWIVPLGNWNHRDDSAKNA